MVDQDDRSIVLNVADDSTNSLVNRSRCLLRVPLRPRQALLAAHVPLRQVLFLQYNDRVCHLRVWNSYQQHTSGCVVRKVQAFRDAATADSHQNGPFVRFSKYCLIVLLDN